MQYVQVQGLSAAYHKVGKGPLLVLLHGWANTWEAWLPVVPELSEHYTLIIPDLPGFGQSAGPSNGWATQDYADWLSSFISKILKQYPSKTLYLAGHSFGGKISALYCSEGMAPEPDKLILIDSSGIPGKLTRKQLVLKLMSQSVPPFLKHTLKEAVRARLYRTFDADSDYLTASQEQRHTLKKVLSENLSPDLPHIQMPTLILWGDSDPATPLSAGEKFHELIPDSQMKVFEAEHFPHHQHPEEVVETIHKFLAKKAPARTKNEQARNIVPKETRKNDQSLVTKLAILQQAEYEWPRFQDWLAHQTGEQRLEPKKWTGKLKALATLVGITRPLGGELVSLWFWNAILKIPQGLFFNLVVKVATFKLRLLQLQGLTVIAIAGSYAKTSTKYVAEHVISGELTSLMTPENINTPIGIARVILGSLGRKHNVFIAELGEYYPGDIRKLTRFLKPDIKILTPVGYAHLERFQTEERLEKGLLELVTTLPDRLTIMHELNAPLISKYGIQANVSLYGESNLAGVEISRAGTEFTVFLPKPVRVFIPLLGTHNAVNCLPALMVADLLTLDIKTAVGRLRTLPHIPHRLEPTLLEHNIFLLDNGYNSNPGSAAESLAVLQQLPASQRIVITPGFVELGDSQESANEEFGMELAKAADLVGIVTGSNDTALLAGLTKAKFNRKNIITGESELEIMNMLQSRIKPNAVILFENSITDVYKSSQ